MDLGLGESEVRAKLSLHDALYPDQFCVGFYESCTIVTHAAILNDFFNASPASMEIKFCDLFCDTEIVVVGQIENAGISGFSHIKNGQRIRAKLEGEEEGVIFEMGRTLKEELNIDFYELPFVIPKISLGRRLDDNQVLNTTMYKIQRL